MVKRERMQELSLFSGNLVCASCD